MTSERADSFSDVQCIDLRFQPHRCWNVGITDLATPGLDTDLTTTDEVAVQLLAAAKCTTNDTFDIYLTLKSKASFLHGI